MAISLAALLKRPRAVPAALIPCLLLLTGCVSTEKWWSFGKNDEPVRPPARFTIFWANEVGFAPDAKLEGRPVPGFAGRMYLFGPEIGDSLPVDGMLSVVLHDPNQRDPDGDYKAIEDWHLPSGMLKQTQRKDFFGLGCTLFLPWKTYHPNVREVLLRAKYVPRDGSVPLFYESGVIRLGGMQVIDPPTLQKSTQPPTPIGPTPRRLGGNATPPKPAFSPGIPVHGR